MADEPLRGERIALESVRPEHVRRLRELRRAPEVARWWDPAPEGWPLDLGPDDHAHAVLHAGEIVGYVQYWEEPDPGSRYADVDIFIAPELQDRALGTDAMRTLVGHLIEDRGHHRLTLSTSVDNAGAIRCYEKVGFRRVGVTHKSARTTRPASGKTSC